MRKCRRLGKIWDRFVLFYRNLLQNKKQKLMTRKIILQNYPHYVGVSRTSIEIAYDCLLLY